MQFCNHLWLCIDLNIGATRIGHQFHYLCDLVSQWLRSCNILQKPSDNQLQLCKNPYCAIARILLSFCRDQDQFGFLQETISSNQIPSFAYLPYISKAQGKLYSELQLWTERLLKWPPVTCNAMTILHAIMLHRTVFSMVLRFYEYTFYQSSDCDLNSQNWSHPVQLLPVQYDNIKYKVCKSSKVLWYQISTHYLNKIHRFWAP